MAVESAEADGARRLSRIGMWPLGRHLPPFGGARAALDGGIPRRRVMRSEDERPARDRGPRRAGRAATPARLIGLSITTSPAAPMDDDRGSTNDSARDRDARESRDTAVARR